MMNWGYYNMMGIPYGGWGGGLLMILWWGLIIAVIVWLIRWMLGQQGNLQRGGSTALDILKERYAKGEISKQEFEDKKKDIL
jgi:putative membrane protein